MKKAKLVGGKPVHDLEVTFSRFLRIGQHRNIDLHDVLGYEFCTIPSSLVDEFGCLRKGNKAALMQQLGKVLDKPSNSDILLIDGNQLLFHIVWPGPGTATAASMKAMKEYEATMALVLFDQYEGVRAKDHERQMIAGDEGTTDFGLQHSTKLPSREAIMKSNTNKKQLTYLLTTLNLGSHFCMVN